MKQFVIREDLAQALLDYLAGRPYQEVYRLIGALHQIAPLDMEEGETRADAPKGAA